MFIDIGLTCPIKLNKAKGGAPNVTAHCTCIITRTLRMVRCTCTVVNVIITVVKLRKYPISIAPCSSVRKFANCFNGQLNNCTCLLLYTEPY